MQFQDPSPLLDALSQRVVRHLSTSVWRKLFLRPCQEVMQFSGARGTFLSVKLPAWSDDARGGRDLDFLAHAHGGEMDPCPAGCALVRFDDPGAALAMALELQRLGDHVRYQVGLASGECTLATLQIEGSSLPLFVGAAVELADEVARQASPGSIRLSPETFALVEDTVVRMGGCMVATEYDGDAVAATSVTPTPRANAFLSTFAGLGLT